MDQQAAELIARANSDMTTQFRQPLVERELFPEVCRFGTTADAMHIVALEAADGSLASPGAPPAATQHGDLVVRVHQSAINSFTNAALGGMSVTAKRFRELTKERLGSLLGDKEPAPGRRRLVDHLRPRPITVGFDGGKFTVTIRGLEFYSDGETYTEAMNVTAVYEIRKTGTTFKAVRQGALTVLPPDFDPKSNEQLAPRVQVLRTMLERRFRRSSPRSWPPRTWSCRSKAASRSSFR